MGYYKKEENLTNSIYKTNNMEDELINEFIIADTDLNVLAYIMNNKDKKYLSHNVAPILRYDNIEALSIELGDHVLNPIEMREFVAIYLNPLDKSIKYKSANDKRDLEYNSLLVHGYKLMAIFNKNEIQFIKANFKDIENINYCKEKLSNMKIKNLCIDKNINVSEENLRQDIDPVWNLIDTFQDFLVNLDNTPSIIEKKEVIKKYRLIGFKILKNFEKNMLNYHNHNIKKFLTYLSLGRLSENSMEKANLIHSLQETIYQELKSAEEIFYANFDEIEKYILNFEK